MKISFYPSALGLASAVLLLSACQTQTSTDDTSTPQPPPRVVLAFTALPTLTPSPTMTPSLTPSETASLTPSVTPSPLPASATPSPSPSATQTPLPSSTPTPSPSFSPTPSRLPLFFLSRPIARGDDLVDWVDRSYPYGGTQFDQREVHLGVEFFNPRFTPVLAAADGIVYHAGTDATQLFGPQLDYYGNLVILQHSPISAEGLPIYTLYGHLHTLSVQSGQVVQAGTPLGQVGDSGIAEGPHLHFEVRVGDPNDYRNTRNPELYLRPYQGFGLLVGHLSSRANQPIAGIPILVRALEGTFRRETYVYGLGRVNSDSAWAENFSLGDIPEGQYEVIVSERTGRVRFRQTIQIEQGRATWLDISVD